jgi:hypothetical protein
VTQIIPNPINRDCMAGWRQLETLARNTPICGGPRENRLHLGNRALRRALIFHMQLVFPPRMGVLRTSVSSCVQRTMQSRASRLCQHCGWIKNRATSGRTVYNVLGNPYPYVTEANVQVSRLVILLWIAAALGHAWVVEQPAGPFAISLAVLAIWPVRAHFAPPAKKIYIDCDRKSVGRSAR